MTFITWLIFLMAAVLEVGGDAVTRTGLRGGRWILVLLGAAMLGFYGIVVNTVRWDFSKLLGVYIAVFAVVSVLTAAFVFRESVTNATWLGIALIVVGGLVIQFGSR